MPSRQNRFAEAAEAGWRCAARDNVRAIHCVSLPAISRSSLATRFRATAYQKKLL